MRVMYPKEAHYWKIKGHDLDCRSKLSVIVKEHRATREEAEKRCTCKNKRGGTNA